jgi:deoxycytidine triphosphate deaminase
MTTLSDADIRRELGNNILIYPFNENNLKGASYNLTASKLAWRIEDGKTAYNEPENKIIIPPGSTVLIETNETIWVAKNISGTYHSKVYWVSKGMGHIGTTLDPDYIGASLIAVHNHSKTPIHLTPEKETETFVSLMFHYVKTKSTKPHLNKPGRPEILKQFQVSQDEDNWLDEPVRNDPERLRAKLKESDAFKNFKKGWRENILYFLPYIISGSLTILGLGVYLYCIISRAWLAQKDWYDTVISITDRVIFISFTAFIVQLTNDVRRG